MTEAEFWENIDESRRGEPEGQVDRLHARLVQLPAAEILHFGYRWSEAHTAAYEWNLWGAAYLINGGCSDDGFIDFRSWLILKGERNYREAVADPDSLARLVNESEDASWECYPAPNVYTQLVQGAEHGDYYTALTAAHGQGTVRPEPEGEDWDFDNPKEAKRRLPELWKKFGNS